LTPEMDRPTVMMQRGFLFAGRYLVERVVGAGGMGVVYQVVDRQTARRRALKVLSPGPWTDRRARDLPREVLVGAAIDSPHVVDILDAGVDDDTGLPFLAMELLRGEDLARRRLRLGRRPPIEVASYLHQVGRALAAIHGAGVVHRDLKPANIFLCRSGGTRIVKVLDFGIAELMEAPEVVTQSGRAGTPAYMAPEQLRGETVSPATDVYALAIVAFELLTGHRYQERVAAAEADLPAQFQHWFARATAPLPRDRFREALLAADELAHALDVPVSSSPFLVAEPHDEEPADEEPESIALPSLAEKPGDAVREDVAAAAIALPRTELSERAVARRHLDGDAPPPRSVGHRRRMAPGLITAALAAGLAMVAALAGNHDEAPRARNGTSAAPPPASELRASLPAADGGTRAPTAASPPPSPPDVPTLSRPAEGRQRPLRRSRRSAAADDDDDSLYTRR